MPVYARTESMMLACPPKAGAALRFSLKTRFRQSVNSLPMAIGVVCKQDTSDRRGGANTLIVGKKNLCVILDSAGDMQGIGGFHARLAPQNSRLYRGLSRYAGYFKGIEKLHYVLNCCFIRLARMTRQQLRINKVATCDLDCLICNKRFQIAQCVLKVFTSSSK